MTDDDAHRWLQLAIVAARSDVGRIEDALLDAGALAVTLTDAEDQPVLEPAPGQTPLWQNTWVCGLFDAQTDPVYLRARLQAQLGADVVAGCRIDHLEGRDWVRAWMEHYHPMCFGTRLWVCPSHQSPPEPDAVNILIDPGLAFGTGTHPSTALCLGWLDGLDLQGRCVLDYGCGSGILAVAALRLGAEQAWAIDIDPQAWTATHENAERNGVGHAINTAAPKGLPTDLAADVVLANILAGPLIELAPRLAAHTSPAGRIALAGLLAEQAEQVLDAYRPWFVMQQTAASEGWVLLTGVRHAAGT